MPDEGSCPIKESLFLQIRLCRCLTCALFVVYNKHCFQLFWFGEFFYCLLLQTTTLGSPKKGNSNLLSLWVRTLLKSWKQFMACGQGNLDGVERFPRCSITIPPCSLCRRVLFLIDTLCQAAHSGQICTLAPFQAFLELAATEKQDLCLPYWACA